MNRWLAHHCREQGYRFMDNWPSFWDRSHLLRADGLHPTGVGAAVLSSNIASGLCQTCFRFDTRDVALSRSQVPREPARVIVSAGMESTSLVNMVVRDIAQSTRLIA